MCLGSLWEAILLGSPLHPFFMTTPEWACCVSPCALCLNGGLCRSPSFSGHQWVCGSYSVVSLPQRLLVSNESLSQGLLVSNESLSQRLLVSNESLSQRLLVSNESLSQRLLMYRNQCTCFNRDRGKRPS